MRSFWLLVSATFDRFNSATKLVSSTAYKSPLLFIGIRNNSENSAKIEIRAIPAIGLYEHHRAINLTLYSVLVYSCITSADVTFSKLSDIKTSAFVLAIVCAGYIGMYFAPKAPIIFRILSIFLFSSLKLKLATDFKNYLKKRNNGVGYIVLLISYTASYSTIFFVASILTIQVNTAHAIACLVVVILAFTIPVLHTFTRDALKVESVETLNSLIKHPNHYTDPAKLDLAEKQRISRNREVKPILHGMINLDYAFGTISKFPLPYYFFLLKQALLPSRIHNPVISPVQNVDTFQSGLGKIFFSKIMREHHTNTGVLAVAYPLIGGWIVLFAVMFLGFFQSAALVFGCFVLLLIALYSLLRMRIRFADYTFLTADEIRSLPAWIAPKRYAGSRGNHPDKMEQPDHYTRRFLFITSTIIYSGLLIGYLTMLTAFEFSSGKNSIFTIPPNKCINSPIKNLDGTHECNSLIQDQKEQ